MGKELFSEQIKGFIHNSISEKNRISKVISDYLYKKKIVIYGAGAIGSTLQHIFSQKGYKIECFFDKKATEIKHVGEIRVYEPEKLTLADADNYVVLIAVYSGIILGYSDEVKSLLQEMCPNANFIADGRTLAYILQFDECRSIQRQNGDFYLVDCINCGFESRGCEIFKEYLLKRAEIVPETYQERLFEQFFGLILGDVCTLKCKYCNEMVPYHDTHTFNSLEQIVGDCRKIIDSCTFMPWVELVGGEPFLYPELKSLLRELLSIKKIGYIKIFTNGTVVPDNELCAILKNERIIINFSNYTDVLTGNLLNNIYETQEILKKYDIRYISSYAKMWQTFNFDDNGKDAAELQKSLACCSCAECQRVDHGVIYRCHHQYAGNRLGKIPYNESDIVNIYDYDDQGLRERCDKFEDMPYILACKYCNWPFDAESVPAAEQL